MKLTNQTPNEDMVLLPKLQGKNYIEVNGLMDLFTILRSTYKFCWIESSLNLQYQVEK